MSTFNAFMAGVILTFAYVELRQGRFLYPALAVAVVLAKLLS